jgi:uncharacterized repeat protein (TIGR02543 family)
MDEDETWYISGGAIKINGSISSKNVSLEKQSERVIQVTESGRKYYLYASRIANTSFTGKIAAFDGASLSVQRAVAGGKGWINVVVEDLDNGSAKTTTTDGGGNFTVTDVIPGDEYRVTPQGGTPVTVTPTGDGDDVGTITITKGVNFKTIIKAPEGEHNEFLYANGARHDFTIEVTNIGTEDCLAATYQLGFESGLVTTASTEKQRWGTIEPGATKTISLSLKCDAIEKEYAYKKISITITDEIDKKTWEDSVSVKFYKVRTYFYLTTESSAAAPVSGVVINPYDSKASRFKQAERSLSYVTMPWSSGEYLVVFSGATVQTEAAYTLSVNRYPPYSDSDFSGFTDLGHYEENDTEQTATGITEDAIMAYLHKNDIDYYRYRVLEPENGSVSVSPNQYTVTFSADGESPAAQTRTVSGGVSLGAANMPANPTKILYVFDGWYTSASGGGTQFTASTTVTRNLTVYAKWTALSLDAALTWLSSNAVVGGAYTITLENNETIAPKTLSCGGKKVSITIMGDTAERTVSLSSTGSLFTVGSGVTLTLGSNVTLLGRSDNTGALVRVDSGGTLIMETGSKISGNATAASSSSYSGGVYVNSSGKFTMSGGTISGNTASSGGGVSVTGNGTFTMSGGTISDNIASNGGGVSVGGATGGTFTMSGGTISGNTASNGGGGVYIYNGTFTKQPGGTIYGSDADGALKNTAADGNGHAVSASFRLSSVGKKQRGSTAGEGVTMDSAKSGAAGGWE